MKWHLDMIIVYRDWRREVWQKYKEVSVEHSDYKFRFIKAYKIFIRLNGVTIQKAVN